MSAAFACNATCLEVAAQEKIAYLLINPRDGIVVPRS